VATEEPIFAFFKKKKKLWSFGSVQKFKKFSSPKLHNKKLIVWLLNRCGGC